MDTLIPARKRAASVALLFCGRDGKTDLSGVGNVGGAGVGNRELGLDKIGGVDRRSCDLKDTKPAAKIKSTASALREVFTKPEWILGIGACKTHISLTSRACCFRILGQLIARLYRPSRLVISTTTNGHCVFNEPVDAYCASQSIPIWEITGVSR